LFRFVCYGQSPPLSLWTREEADLFIFLCSVPEMDPWAIWVRLCLRLTLSKANFTFVHRRPYLIPLFYFVHLWTTFLVNRKIPHGPTTPAEAALVPKDPKLRPSFADVAAQGSPAPDAAVHEEHPHVVPDSPSSGSISKRNKKKKNGNRQVQLAAGEEATDGDDSDSALVKFQKLPRNRPQPKATLSQLVRSILFGTPTPTSSFLNYAAIAVNTLSEHSQQPLSFAGLR